MRLDRDDSQLNAAAGYRVADLASDLAWFDGLSRSA
jgi:hypothetical protein